MNSLPGHPIHYRAYQPIPEAFDAVAYIHKAVAAGVDPKLIFNSDGTRYISFKVVTGDTDVVPPRPKDDVIELVADALLAMGRIVDLRRA